MAADQLNNDLKGRPDRIVEANIADLVKMDGITTAQVYRHLTEHTRTTAAKSAANRDR